MSKKRHTINDMNRDVTYDRLHEVLAYNPKTGKFYWRVSLGTAKAWTEAGKVRTDGYIDIQIDGKLYRAHRLAWLYVHGYHPENFIDHRDRDKGNNRIENLRHVSMVCNLRNCGNHAHNTSGVKGVYWNGRDGKWPSQIQVNGRGRSLGYYDDFADAVCARLAGEQCVNWSGCDSSSPAYQWVQKHVIEPYRQSAPLPKAA